MDSEDKEKLKKNLVMLVKGLTLDEEFIRESWVGGDADNSHGGRATHKTGNDETRVALCVVVAAQTRSQSLRDVHQNMRHDGTGEITRDGAVYT